MGMPTITVEVAFTTDPGATPTWTDISAYQEEFVVHRGRADDQSAFGPGQLQLTLANEDRRFDPAYTSSPYSPNVVPMRRIRIRATYNSITYDIFNGYVTNWRQVYNPPQMARCVVEATDAFKVLGNIELAVSVYATEILVDAPQAWYRLDEPAGATTAREAVAARHAPAYGTGVTFGAAGLVTRDPGAAMTTLGGADTPHGIALPAGASPTGTGDFTIEFLLSTTMIPTNSIIILEVTGGASADYFNIGLTANFIGNSGVQVQHGLTVNGPGVSPSVNDGNPHQITVKRASGTVTLYIDGAVAGSTFAAGESLGPFVSFGSPAVNANNAFTGTLDELAFYSTALSAARIAAHWDARKSGGQWAGDTSGARINRILDAAGWPTADRNIDAGQAVLQSADLLPVTLANLQRIEQTEQGALFVTAAGLVRFIARNNLLTAPYTTSQGTFGDSGSELEYGELTYTYDDNLIFNEVHVSRSGGTVAIVKDATSQTKYLRRTKTLDGLLHQSDLTSVDLANWVLAHYKDPSLRITGMRLEPARANEATHFPHVLGRELMDRVTVLRRPQNLGAAISQDTLIEGITHTVSAVDWVTQWNLSPAEAQGYWILGVAGSSELGSTTRLGF